MEITELFVYWLYLILAVYFTLLLVMVVQRARRGTQAAGATSAVQVHERTIEARHGADPRTLVGLFVIAAALLGMTVSLGVGLGAIHTLTGLPGGVLSGGGLFMLVSALVALASLCWSVWLGFGRWGVKIDGDARTVVSWWGFLVPMKSRQYRLETFNAVVVRSGPKKLLTRGPTYTIGLEGTPRPVLVDRATCETRERAQELARRLAKITGLTVQDLSK
jgi:hypothetical protein